MRAINLLAAVRGIWVRAAVPGADPAPPVPARRRELGVALLLSVLAFVVFNANMRLISAGDNYPARYLPLSILKNRTVAVDPIADVVAQGHPRPFWCVESGGHVYSRYPVTIPVLAAPLYVPAATYLDDRGWAEERLESVARLMEKLVASMVASLSAGLMYLLLVRRTSCPRPLLLTFAYALGTNTWMISSQALWQHGPAQLLILGALFLVLGPCSAPRALAAGVCLGLVAAVRPPDAIFSAALGLYGLRWARGNVRLLLLGAVLPLLPLLAYNVHVAGTPVGAYGNGVNKNPFKYSLLQGLLGLLFSPARGLFVFSPFLLFLPQALAGSLREGRHRALCGLIGGAAGATLVLYAKLDWRAGCAWGPRWLTDMLPLLVWMLADGLGRLRGFGRAAFVLAVGLSIGVQAVGAFWYTGASDALFYTGASDPNAHAAVWELRNAPFLVELRHPPAPRDLLLEARGTVDRVSAGGAVIESIVPGPHVDIEGWTLTDRRTPAVVQVSLIPIGPTPYDPDRGYPVTSTNTFFERADVTATMRGNGPAGWKVTLPTDGLAPGPHLIEVKAQGAERGELRHAARRRVDVLPGGGLRAEARAAATRLRQRQHADGYWLTAHTVTTRYERQTPEMNVFVTAMIHDTVGPFARAAGFEDQLERARGHLRGQIEASGLVRYHGRPGSPTIPALGCVITPDADDTALAWRIAGPNGDARRAAALGVLKSYRDFGGLYRTWLAPRTEYVSIDPGADPNPPDVAIQMHVLLWLREADPDAAKALHRSLRSAIADDRVWVYYKRAPLVPLLRAGELTALGFQLQVPPDRLKTGAPGQDVWVEACRQLASYTAKDSTRPAPAETRDLLERLARDDFAAVRTDPPLMYHNDPTAKCSRFYWSEDFGYALWLRLYLELNGGAPLP